jgi:Putative prokaryotic signal transducing protein
MRVVYEAENIIDAHLVKGLLEQQGIPAFVKGEYLTGAIGDLPAMGLVAVCVPESRLPEAEAVMRGWNAERARPIADPGWDPEPEPA